MRLQDFWTTLMRRWYLALIALVLAIGGTFYIVDKVGPTYEAEGSVLVFPPVATVQRETELQTQGNPYLVLNGVSQARDIVIRALTSKSTLDELADQYPDATFEATPDFTNSAPIILITTDAGSAEEATAALSAIMDRVPKILDDLQSGLDLPSQAMITSRPLVADNEPDAKHSNQIRAGIVAAVLALGIGLLLVGLIDGLLTGRTNKKGEKPGRGDKTTPPRAGGGTAPEPDTRGQERSRRLGPRSPVRPKGERIAPADGRQEAGDQLTDRRLQSVSFRVDDSSPSSRAAKA